MQRGVLEAAAVLGADPDWTILEEVTGAPEPLVLGALRAATPHLLVPEGDELRWRHTLTRQAVLARVTPPERAAVARRAAEALLSRGESARDAYAAELLAAAGEGRRSAEVFLRLARQDMDTGALRSAEDRLTRASATRTLRPAVAIERVRLLTLLGQVPAALEAGTEALAEVVGGQHAELCLRLAEAAIVARRWGEADRFIERAGRPGDPRALVLAADSAFGAGDLRRAADLAAVAADRAEQEGRWETVCQALTTLGRCAMRHDVATARAAYARAAQTSAERRLIPARVTALLGLAAVDLLDHATSSALGEAGDLARSAGLLVEVVRSDLLLADVMITTAGPRAAQALAQQRGRAGRPVAAAWIGERGGVVHRHGARGGGRRGGHGDRTRQSCRPPAPARRGHRPGAGDPRAAPSALPGPARRRRAARRRDE